MGLCLYVCTAFRYQNYKKTMKVDIQSKNSNGVHSDLPFVLDAN